MPPVVRSTAAPLRLKARKRMAEMAQDFERLYDETAEKLTAAEGRVAELENALHHIAWRTAFCSRQEMRQYARTALETKGQPT